MRNLGTLLLLILTPILGYTQTDIENVKQAIQTAYETQDPSAGLSALKNVEEKIENVPDSVKAKFYLGVATAYGQMGQSDSSFFFLNKLDNVASRLENKDIQLRGLNVKGNVQLMLGDYDDAVTSFYRALEIAEDDYAYIEHITKINGNLAGVFFDKGDFDSAEKYTQQALDLSIKSKSKPSQAFNILRLGLIAQAKNKIEKSLRYGNEAEKLFTEMNDTTMLIYSKMNWADVLKNEKKYAEAQQKYNEALTLSQALNDPETTAACHIAIGQILLKQNSKTKAKEAANKALHIATQSQIKSKMLEAYDLLYAIAYRNRKFEQALQYKNSYYVLSDSLNNVATNGRIAELQTKYETAQKEAEIEQLALDNEVQQLEISKAQNNLIAIIIIAGIIIIGSISLVIMRNKRMEAERIAQESQLDALKQRVLQLQLENPSQNIQLEFNDINNKIATPLTDREFETLSLSLSGKSNQEIADELFVSINTIKFHLRNIYQKLGVSNKKEALQYVAQN